MSPVASPEKNSVTNAHLAGELKHCANCNIHLPVSAFYTKGKQDFDYQCRSCQARAEETLRANASVPKPPPTDPLSVIELSGDTPYKTYVVKGHDVSLCKDEFLNLVTIFELLLEWQREKDKEA